MLSVTFFLFTVSQQQNSNRTKTVTHSQGSHALPGSGEKVRVFLCRRQKCTAVPVTEQTVQESKSLCPTDPEAPAYAQAFVTNLFLSEVAELIPTTLREMPTC